MASGRTGALAMTVEQRIDELVSKSSQARHGSMGTIERLETITRCAVKLLRRYEEFLDLETQAFLDTGLIPPEGNTKGKVGDGD
jgi:hypothetical protein